jgi:ABC-type sugar transport system ATPase subunit
MTKNAPYVTHDQVEAMTLADRVVVMNQGRIEQIGAAPIRLAVDLNNMHLLNEVTGIVL